MVSKRKEGLRGEEWRKEAGDDASSAGEKEEEESRWLRRKKSGINKWAQVLSKIRVI